MHRESKASLLEGSKPDVIPTVVAFHADEWNDLPFERRDWIFAQTSILIVGGDSKHVPEGYKKATTIKEFSSWTAVSPYSRVLVEGSVHPLVETREYESDMLYIAFFSSREREYQWEGR